MSFLYYPHTLPIVVAVTVMVGLLSIVVVHGIWYHRIRVVVRNIVRTSAVMIALNAVALLFGDVMLVVRVAWAIKSLSVATFICFPLFGIVVAEWIVASVLWSITVPIDDGSFYGS